MPNPALTMTLDQAVEEVLSILTGMDLHYAPELDRYRSITHVLNRALRANALEHEWSWYCSVESIGTSVEGQASYDLISSLRPRIINDDAVRLVDEHGHAVLWAYFLPRDALHKYPMRGGLWVSSTRSTIQFSRPFTAGEAGFDIQVPVMREPRRLVVPATLENIEQSMDTPPGNEGLTADEIRAQQIDFQYPDLVVSRAAFLYAQTDPIMQPRVQSLEAAYKDIMYQVIERDDRNTDSPFMNEFFVPVQNSINGPDRMGHWHPHSDERRI